MSMKLNLTNQRLVCLPWLVLVLASCTTSGGPSDGPRIGGESHFLQVCGQAADCPEGLDCLCGVCTVSCDDVGDCQGLLGETGTCFEVVSDSGNDGLGICNEREVDGVCLPECGSPGAGPCVQGDGLVVPNSQGDTVRPIPIPVAATSDALADEEGTHYAALSAHPGRGDILLVFRDSDRPAADYQSFLATAALAGFHALLIDYDTTPYVEAECPDEPEQEAISCLVDARTETLFGVTLDGDSINGFTTRAWALYEYLEREYPQFWEYQTTDVDAWEALEPTLVAHGDGGPLAMEYARNVSMNRVVFVQAHVLDQETEKDVLFEELATPLDRLHFLAPDVPGWDEYGTSFTAAGIDDEVDMVQLTDGPVPDGRRLVLMQDLPETITSLILDSGLDEEMITRLIPIWTHMLGGELP